jgi:hypothetical protein
MQAFERSSDWQAAAADRLIFPDPAELFGVRLPVAALEHLVQGKLWALQDPERRASKKAKAAMKSEFRIKNSAHEIARMD